MTKKKKQSEDIDEIIDRIMLLSAREKAPPAKPFHPAKYQCDKCSDIIFSKYPGQFVECKCGLSFVDQTRYYARVGGSMTMVEKGKEDE